MRPRVGVGLVVRRGDELLLMRRRRDHGHGTWSAPGGYLEAGEEPAACAVREATEETRVTVGEPRFVGVTNDVFPEEGRHSVTLCFEVEYVAGTPVPDPDEVAEVAWFPRERLPEPLFPPMRRILVGETVR